MQLSRRGRTAGRISPLAAAVLAGALFLGTAGGAVAGVVITGKQIKDGTVTGADIRNESLSKADLVDEPRVFSAIRGVAGTDELDDFTADDWTPIVSRTLKVRKGFLHITGSLFTEADATLGGDGLLYYSIKVNNKVIPLNAYLDTQAGTNDYGKEGSVTVTVPVPAGQHTVSLVAHDDDQGSYIYERSINAVWLPTGSQAGPLFPAKQAVERSTANR